MQADAYAGFNRLYWPSLPGLTELFMRGVHPEG
jgi:hypothetical protein